VTPGALLVATLGSGLWHSEDGARWQRDPGLDADARLYSLAGTGPGLLAGGEGAVYRHHAGRWRRIALADETWQVWTLAVDPRTPATVFAGCRPLALLRSDDGGERWRALPFDLPPGTERPHTPRVTALLVEAGALWCGVEVGGVFRSGDGGEQWTVVNDGLPSLDVHALARGRALLAATPRGIARLADGDGRWEATDLKAPWRYCRALAALPARPGEALCGLGDGPPGTRGAVVVTEDDGRSWHSALFPGVAGSSVWSVAVAPADPDVAIAGAIGGEVFTSEDGGRTWTRVQQRFAEVRAVHATR
jgi:photosystem II stability/assembly factor-like uncharacterized protein